MTPKASNAEIIAELTRAKVEFQLRTIALVIGVGAVGHGKHSGVVRNG